MSSKKRLEGYFLRDERLAYGRDAILETWSLTCAHCNRVVVVLPDATRAKLGLPPRSHPRGWCAKCDAYVCDFYACNNFCTPILKMIEIAQRHPDIPVLQRNPDGTLPFDPACLDERHTY